MLTLQDLLTSSNKYPERAKSKELTAGMLHDGQKLIDRVNGLLNAIAEALDDSAARIDMAHLVREIEVSSGFRPSSINNAIANAAKKSLHMTCNAIDLSDPTGKLDEFIASKPELLKKFNLWLEDPEFTKGGWAHLDQSTTRKNRVIRIFKP